MRLRCSRPSQQQRSKICKFIEFTSACGCCGCCFLRWPSRLLLLLQSAGRARLHLWPLVHVSCAFTAHQSLPQLVPAPPPPPPHHHQTNAVPCCATQTWRTQTYPTFQRQQLPFWNSSSPAAPPRCVYVCMRQQCAAATPPAVGG